MFGFVDVICLQYVMHLNLENKYNVSKKKEGTEPYTRMRIRFLMYLLHDHTFSNVLTQKKILFSYNSYPTLHTVCRNTLYMAVTLWSYWPYILYEYPPPPPLTLLKSVQEFTRSCMHTGRKNSHGYTTIAHTGKIHRPCPVRSRILSHNSSDIAVIQT